MYNDYKTGHVVNENTLFDAAPLVLADKGSFWHGKRLGRGVHVPWTLNFTNFSAAKSSVLVIAFSSFIVCLLY